MPFALSNKPTFNFRVVFRRPDEAGKWQAYDFRAVFKRLDAARVKELHTAPPSDSDLLDEVWNGWVPADIKDTEGNNLEVTDVNRSALLAEPGMSAAIVQAWIEAVITGPVKN
jgi:hypothetical protein